MDEQRGNIAGRDKLHWAPAAWGPTEDRQQRVYLESEPGNTDATRLTVLPTGQTQFIHEKVSTMGEKASIKHGKPSDEIDILRKK